MLTEKVRHEEILSLKLLFSSIPRLNSDFTVTSHFENFLDQSDKRVWNHFEKHTAKPHSKAVHKEFFLFTNSVKLVKIYYVTFKENTIKFKVVFFSKIRCVALFL